MNYFFYWRWLDIFWWGVKRRFKKLFLCKRLIRTDFSKQDSLVEIATDWTWRWEFQDRWVGVVFNAGTKDHPEWACMR
jgi:hypothetical protein